jgi:hypothetical protein
MYAVELDQSKRLLVISAVHRVTAEQVKAVAQHVSELLQDIAPGFRVLVDFRWLDLMDPAAAPRLAEIMEALTEKGAASVARVMPDPHKDIWSKYSFTIPLRTADPNRDLRDVGRCAAKCRSETGACVGLMPGPI